MAAFMGDDEAGDDDDDDDDEGSDGSSGGGVEDNLDFFDWLEEFTEKMEKVAKIIMKYVPLVCLLLQFCSHSRLTRLLLPPAVSIRHGDFAFTHLIAIGQLTPLR